MSNLELIKGINFMIEDMSNILETEKSFGVERFLDIVEDRPGDASIFNELHYAKKREYGEGDNVSIACILMLSQLAYLKYITKNIIDYYDEDDPDRSIGIYPELVFDTFRLFSWAIDWLRDEGFEKADSRAISTLQHMCATTMLLTSRYGYARYHKLPI